MAALAELSLAAICPTSCIETPASPSAMLTVTARYETRPRHMGVVQYSFVLAFGP